MLVIFNKLAGVALLITLLIFPSSRLFARTRLVINTPGEAPYHFPDQSGAIDQLVKEAFRRLDIDVRVQWLPMERSLINANNGIDDGDAGRIAGLEKKYPNLIMVPERLIDSEFVAFTKGLEFASNGWESLQPYDVAIIKGFQIGEINIKNTHSLIKVENTQKLFKLLEYKRVEVVVMEKVFGLYAVREMKLSGIKIMAPSLEIRKMYIYLHKKHAALVPQLAAALKAMQEDGTYQRIMQGVNKFEMP